MAPQKHRDDQLFVAPVKFAGPVEFVVPPSGLPGHSDPILLSPGTVGDPTYSFIADPDTGVFNPDADVLGFAAGGVEAMRFTEGNGSVLQAPEANVGLTADIGSAQGDGVITSSYNVYSTVATAGDAATLPAVFDINSLIYIKNDGAESMDVFPALGDNAGAGADTAVAIASGESKTFIATVANAAWTELLVSGGGVPDPLLLGDGLVSAPTYSFANSVDSGLYSPSVDQVNMAANGFRVFEAKAGGAASLAQLVIPRQGHSAPKPSFAFGDGDTGFYESTDDALRLSIDGTDRIGWDTTRMFSLGGGGFQLNYTGASATVPTLIPDVNDNNTGIGRAAVDQLSLIAGGVQIAQAKEAVGANQFIVAPGAVQNNPAAPSLGFGDGDTGFFESADDNLVVATLGVDRFFWAGTVYGGLNGSSAAMLNVASSLTVPTMTPNRGDTDTGIGGDSADQIALIAGGLDCIRVRETAAARQIGFYVTAPISLQTGVAVTDVAIHAALVNLGLITA